MPKTENLFPDLPTQITLRRQISCVEREIRFRHFVYPKRIQAGKMTADMAKSEISCMEAVLETLKLQEDYGTK